MNEKDLKAVAFVAVLVVVGLGTPTAQKFLQELFSAIISAVFLGVLLIIIGTAVWFFFFRD